MYKRQTQNIVISRILDGMPAEKIAEGYEVSLDYVKPVSYTHLELKAAYEAKKSASGVTYDATWQAAVDAAKAAQA